MSILILPSQLGRQAGKQAKHMTSSHTTDRLGASNKGWKILEVMLKKYSLDLASRSKNERRNASCRSPTADERNIPPLHLSMKRMRQMAGPSSCKSFFYHVLKKVISLRAKVKKCSKSASNMEKRNLSFHLCLQDMSNDSTFHLLLVERFSSSFLTFASF